MSSEIRFNNEEVDKIIEEKRKELDARFTIWSTRIRAISRSADLNSMADDPYTTELFNNCNCVKEPTTSG